MLERCSESLLLFCRLNASQKVKNLFAQYNGIAIISIWMSFDANLLIFAQCTKEYTIIVDIIIHDIVTIRYDKNLLLMLLFFLKFFLRFKVKDVISQHHSLIIFDIIMGSHKLVKIKNTPQSTMAATHDNKVYKIACFVSFFALLRIYSFIILSKN